MGWKRKEQEPDPLVGRRQYQFIGKLPTQAELAAFRAERMAAAQAALDAVVTTNREEMAGCDREIERCDRIINDMGVTAKKRSAAVRARKKAVGDKARYAQAIANATATANAKKKEIKRSHRGLNGR